MKENNTRDRDMESWQTRRPGDQETRREGPEFAKRGYRTLLAILSLLVLARAYGCLLMTGDANAAAYRLYSTTRADQKGGARPDPKNCTLEVACRLFQDAFNKGTAIRNRMMLSVIHTCTSYSLANEYMKSWMNNSCTRVLDSMPSAHQNSCIGAGQRQKP